MTTASVILRLSLLGGVLFFAGGSFFAVGSVQAPAASEASDVDPEVDQLLQRISRRMSAIPKLRFRAEITYDELEVRDDEELSGLASSGRSRTIAPSSRRSNHSDHFCSSTHGARPPGRYGRSAIGSLRPRNAGCRRRTGAGVCSRTPRPLSRGTLMRSSTSPMELPRRRS